MFPVAADNWQTAQTVGRLLTAFPRQLSTALPCSSRPPCQTLPSIRSVRGGYGPTCAAQADAFRGGRSIRDRLARSRSSPNRERKILARSQSHPPGDLLSGCSGFGMQHMGVKPEDPGGFRSHNSAGKRGSLRLSPVIAGDKRDSHIKSAAVEHPAA